MFSEAKAAAVTCAIIKPELTPPLFTKNGGNFDRLESINNAIRRSEIAPNSAIAIAKLSAAIATGSAWKLPPEIALSNDKQYSNFIPTNLSCNWGKNSGCVCLDQKQFNYLSSRGYKSD